MAGLLLIHRLTSSLIFLSVISVSLTNSCNFDVNVVQVLRNEGFHRNLTYSITFHADDDERWRLTDCIIGIDQLLPAGVYTNTDELSDLRRAQKVNAIPNNRVNVELPAEQSSPMSVYLVGALVDGQAEVWLPVHARYHKATSGGGLATNTIEAPKLYLRCPDDRLGGCDLYRSAKFFCDGGSKETCSWRVIPFTMMTPPRQWNVPVGNTDHYYLVSIGTTVAVLLGSLYILKAVHEYKTREKKTTKMSQKKIK